VRQVVLERLRGSGRGEFGIGMKMRPTQIDDGGSGAEGEE